MVNIKTVNELQENINDIAIVKIGTKTCGPCKLMHSNLIEVEKTNSTVKFAEIDADDCEDELLDILNIRNVPVMILFKNGIEVKRVTGLQTVDNINEFLK